MSDQQRFDPFEGEIARFHKDGQGAMATLVIGGQPAGTVDVPFAMFMMSSIGPSIGFDHGSAVSDRYEAPFAFAGDLQRVDIQLLGHRPPDESTAANERAAMSRQ